jgi:diguanylate cyclase (GGDEF)-like protein
VKTKRILTEEDARFFFETSINTMEDAIGVGLFDLDRKHLTLDFNAVLLLRFDDVYADTIYKVRNPLFDQEFNDVLMEIRTIEITSKSEFEYIRKIDSEIFHFSIKLEKTDTRSMVRLVFMCYEKLLDTEYQIGLFSKVVGSGLSLFSGSTWWIDYDKNNRYFYQSDEGPMILGLEINENKLYSIEEFQKVREKARIVSSVYEESIMYEQESYEKVRRNETNYFAGRTPAVTKEDDIVWVEMYGKCILRYPDGSPRLTIAIDIYMSEIYEEKNQLQLLNNLIDYGLVNSDVGIWYHQRHYLEGKYYFTPSYQKLMSNTRIYKDDSISDILREQISLMIAEGNGYEEFLYEFRRVHNSIYTAGLDKYHLVIPNFKDENTFQWIEVRGTVIERDDEGHVLLFVGVNVDVTEATRRNRELERLRVQNERLQLAENLAVKARELMVWYQEIEYNKVSLSIFGNETLSNKLGIRRENDGSIKLSSIYRTLVDDDEDSLQMSLNLKRSFESLYRKEKNSFTQVLAKHRNLITNEIYYMEHSVEVADYHDDLSVKLLGGVILDVTTDRLYQQQIRYLADYDTLTNVHNRNYFETYIEDQLPNSYTIMIYDLDGLKLVNDVFGHLEGDRIIIQLAKFLKQVYKDNLFISRIGGDEFAVLLNFTNETKLDVLEKKLKKLLDEFNQGSKVEMTISKGMKQVLNNDVAFEKAFIEAENIMYRSKLNNRSSRKSKVLESILETLNAKTEETKEHSERLSVLAVETMKQLNMLRSDEIADMKLLARVHDIGKITIDDQILKKPESLDDGEYELVKKHSEAGYKIIRNITDSDDVCNGVLLHHEKWDGTGYPQGLKGEDIPIFARIISVVDSFDAMTNDRIYRSKMTVEDAILEIRKCAGTQFDPKVVEAFLAANFKNIK